MLTKEQIENSLEAKWRTRQVYTYAGIFGITVIITLFMELFALMLHGFSKENLSIVLDTFFPVISIFFVVFLPFGIYCQTQYMALFKSLETYTVHEVLLDKPSTAYFYRGAIYYTVSMDIGSRTVKAETKPLFTSGLLSSFPLEEYNNKKIKVAYSETLDKLIVLGK